MLHFRQVTPILVLLTGCATAEDEPSTYFTTTATETSEPAPSYPNGLFAISLLFEGYTKPVDTCLDLDLKSLYIDMSHDGSVQPTATYPCDGQTIMVTPNEPGEWTISVKTVPFTSSAKGVYGESYGYLSEAEVDEVTDLVIQVICYDDDGNGCDTKQ